MQLKLAMNRVQMKVGSKAATPNGAKVEWPMAAARTRLNMPGTVLISTFVVVACAMGFGPMGQDICRGRLRGWLSGKWRPVESASGKGP